MSNSQSRYDILVLGDFHYGESYGKAGARVLANQGYEHSTENLRPFIDACDYVVVNLESPIVDPSVHPSPYVGRKAYCHWADTNMTPAAMKRLGIDAVGLANNHMLDHGQAGLLSTLDRLDAANIQYFGAGRDVIEASQPLTVALPKEVGGGEVRFHASFQWSSRYDSEFAFYASDDTPGCAALPSTLKTPPLMGGRVDVFDVAFPHWGQNYRWASKRQRRLSSDLLKRSYDLVLGHGSHCIQEIELRDGRWVVYSIGNGVFQSGGRFQRYMREHGIYPMGFWAIIEIRCEGDMRSADLKLYPTYSDNHKTGFQPGPVTEKDFEQLADKYVSAISRSWDSGQQPHSLESDSLGGYIRLDLGTWPLGSAPERLHVKRSKPGAEAGLSTDRLCADGYYGDEESLRIREQQSSMGRNVAPLLISAAAAREGAKTDWLDSRFAIVTLGNRSILLQGHRGGESAVAKAIISDKHVCKKILSSAGVSTPRGDCASTVDEAIDIFERYGAPVVVKPRSGQKQRGVSVDIRTVDEVRLAYERAAIDGDVVVEEYIPGKAEYRCLTTPWRCTSVVERVLPSVVGDGVSSIHQLVSVKNVVRQDNPSTFNRPIPLDDVTAAFLKKQGYTFDSVLPNGEVVIVRDVGGLSTGGEPHECSEVVSEDVKMTAMEAARAIPGLTWGGADVLVSRDGGRPYLIEINSDADIAGASFPFAGEPVDVGGAIWKMRIDSASSLPDIEPSSLSLCPSPWEIERRVGAVWGNRSAVRLSVVFHEYLRAGGLVYAENSRLVREVTSDGAESWFMDCMTTEDLAVVYEAVRRHRIVRRMLALANIPRVRGRRVRSMDELLSFVGAEECGVVLIPYGAEWCSGSVVVFGSVSEVASDALTEYSSWIAQTRPAGCALRVFASASEVLVVTGRERPETVDVVNAAGRVAVDAVRAVPGLRWAAVDVLVRTRAGGRTAGLVEGMSVNPTVNRSHLVLAGSFDNLWSTIRNEGKR